MPLYNELLVQGLNVIIDREAYEGIFDGPRGQLVKGLTGLIVAVGIRGPGSMTHGLVKISIDVPQSCTSA